jgi:hypothetical protein
MLDGTAHPWRHEPGQSEKENAMGEQKARDQDREEPLQTTDDTEGHGLLVDPYSARKLDNSRAADVERQSRDRQLRKEARPNR